ncbi:MAG: hypothetical protein ACOC4C_03645, partial [Fibrobacterota bacterium]
MVRINLLKTNVRKATRSPSIMPRVMMALGIVAVIAVIGGGILVGINYVNSGSQPKPRMVTESKHAPSTFSQKRVVEEVVREMEPQEKLNHTSGHLSLSYDELSFEDKINYEIHFAKNVCEFLTDVVPQGIGFKRFVAKDFETLQGSGISDSRTLVAGMFKGFIQKGTELLPKPYTVIRPKDDSYQFTLSGSKQFGLDLAAPFIISPQQLPSRDDVAFKVKEIARLGKENGLRFQDDIQAQTVEAVGKSRRHRFTFSAHGSYEQFVRFIAQLYD